MSRFNPRAITNSEVLLNSGSWNIRGNTYVSDQKSGNRIFDTRDFWRLESPVTFPAALYAAGGGTFVLSQQGGTSSAAAKYATASSYPSSSWTTRTHTVPQVDAMIYHNGYFLVAGNSGGGTGLLYYSTDAITWTAGNSGGFPSNRLGVFGRYNYGLSRYEACTLANDPSGVYGVYSAINAPTSWSLTTSTATNNSPTYAHQISNDYFIYGTASGQLAYGTPGPYATTYLAAPAGNSPGIIVTGLAGTQLNIAGIQYYAIISGNLYAGSTGTPSTPPSSWTLINNPGGDRVFIKTASSQGTAVVIVTSRTGRVWIAKSTASPSTSNLNWIEVSPPVNTNYAITETGTHLAWIYTNNFGGQVTLNTFGRGKTGSGTTSAVDGLLTTNLF